MEGSLPRVSGHEHATCRHARRKWRPAHAAKWSLAGARPGEVPASAEWPSWLRGSKSCASSPAREPAWPPLPAYCVSTGCLHTLGGSGATRVLRRAVPVEGPRAPVPRYGSFYPYSKTQPRSAEVAPRARCLGPVRVRGPVRPPAYWRAGLNPRHGSSYLYSADENLVLKKRRQL